MISIKEGQLLKELGLTRRKEIWSREGRDLSHISSKIILKDS
jgi:hypothetical protein